MFQLIARLAVVCSFLSLTACGGGGGGGRSSGLNPPSESLPTIRSFSPAPEAQALAGETVHFQVIADADSGVEYTWAVDGEALEGHGRSFSLTTTAEDPEERTVEVEVSSGGLDGTILVWLLKVLKTPPANSPPAITSTVPPTPLTVLSTETVPFRVMAADADGADALKYRWLVDGQPQTGEDPDFTFAAGSLAQGQHQVEVRVDDGLNRPAPDNHVWTLDVMNAIPGNRPPLLSAVAPQGVVRIGEGSRLKLMAEASDPEGAPLTYHWQVNAAPQPGRGKSLNFNPAATGSFTVEVLADDGAGGENPSSYRWEVQVVRSLLNTGPAPGAPSPRSKIVDLAASSPRSASMRLSWTAPEIGPTGRGARYDLRYSTRRITGATWNDPQVTRVNMTLTPSAPGAAEEVIVGGLAAQTGYYFAIKTQGKTQGADSSWSPLSEVAKGTTLRNMTGKDIWVSTSGSDSNDGSASRPYRTVAKGCSVSVAGDTVRVRRGLYVRDSMSPRSGTAVVSEDGALKAVLDGQGQVQHLARILGKDDIVIDGFELKNAGGTAGDGNDVVWIDGNGSADGSRNITLRNLFVHGAGFQGDCVKVTNHVYNFLWEDSRATDAYNVAAGEDEELLDMKQVFGAVVRNNWFYHTPGSFGGAMVYSKTDSRDVVFESNIFGPQSTYATDSAVGGGWSSSSASYNTDGLVVKNNLFIDVYFSAVGAYAARNEFIYNNVFYNCGRGGGGIVLVTEGGSIDDSQNIYFINNVVIDDQGKMPSAIYKKQSIAGLTNFERHHNLFWNNGKPIPAGGYADPSTESGFINADPQFANPSAAVGSFDFQAMAQNFRVLNRASQAVNTGFNARTHPYANVATDIFGASRLLDAYDRGIFELVP